MSTNDRSATATSEKPSTAASAAPAPTRSEEAPSVTPARTTPPTGAENPPATPGTPPPGPPAEPEPPAPTSRAVLVGMAVVGATAALTLPLDRPGLGWLLTSAAGAAATVVLARLLGGRPGPSPLNAVGWGAATLALFAVGTVRDAGWLFALCVLAACVTGSLAVAGGRSARELAAGAVAVPLAALRCLPWVSRALWTPRSRRAPRLGVALVLTLGLLVVFGNLLASADAAFSAVLSKATPDLRVDTALRWVFLFTTGALAAAGAAYLTVTRRASRAPSSPARALHRLEWVLPLAALVALFAGFVAVQLAVLFGGHRHVLETAGLTYAEYARGGFWQLLTVTVLTLVVMAAAARWAGRGSRTDRWLIRSLLGGLAVLTLVIVASALYRMGVYEQAYGLTRLRLLVTAVELWLGLIFVMVLLALVRLRASWLPRAVVATGVVTLLALAVLNPDRFLAERNIDRYAETGRVDMHYLAGLSADAVPALDQLPEDLRGCALRRLEVRLSRQPDTFGEWNLSRHQARALLSERPLPVCRAVEGRGVAPGRHD